MPLSYLQNSLRDCRGTSGTAPLAVATNEATASTFATVVLSNNTSFDRQHRAIVGATATTFKAGRSTVATHPAAAADAAYHDSGGMVEERRSPPRQLPHAKKLSIFLFRT